MQFMTAWLGASAVYDIDGRFGNPGQHSKNRKEHIINAPRTSYANKTRESVRPVDRRPWGPWRPWHHIRWSVGSVPVFPWTSYTDEIVAMDAEDADPDREEKLKAAKEKVSYIYWIIDYWWSQKFKLIYIW